MSENQFSLGGKEYKLGKLDAFKQFHIMRRVGPILSDLLPALQAEKFLDGKDIDKMSTDEKLDMVGKFVTPIMTGFSKLSDQDADFVLMGLLQAVEIKGPVGNWAKMATPAGLMFQDHELPTLIQLAGRAFMFNLTGFFAALPQS